MLRAHTCLFIFFRYFHITIFCLSSETEVLTYKNAGKESILAELMKEWKWLPSASA